MDLNTITEVARPKARAALPDWRAGDAWLAGGTWLYSEPQPRLSRLIDLAALGWEPLRPSADGLDIAATCTIAQLNSAALPVEWVAAPLIDQCCRAFLASFKIWTMATVGGNLCMSLPAGPMIALTAALDGVCTVWKADGSERKIRVVDFVEGPQRNALGAGDLLRRIELPASALTRRTAFRQIALSKLGRSGALLIGTLDPGNGAFALTVTAATPRPIQFSFSQPPGADVLLARIDAELPLAAYYDDIHGKPAWRRRVTLHLAEEIRRELFRGRP
ncbi:MAG: FAD binding domain-containing protein [Pseudolabrys sp.]